MKYLKFTPSVCKGIEIRKSEILTRTHFISLQTMIYVSNYQICYSNVFLKQIIQNKFVFGLDYWLDPELLELKTTGFGGIQTQGKKQKGSEEYTLQVQNNRVRRNTNSRYKTIGFGGIQTLGTTQQGSEEYKLKVQNNRVRRNTNYRYKVI